jgi:hypothetical protein
VRQVKGIIFADYVRMLRARKDVDWSQRLPAEDVALLKVRIEPEGWYPMATFERYGLVILEDIGAHIELVRAWGQASVDALVTMYPTLLAKGEPRETLMRFHVLRKTFFNFPAIDVQAISDGEAQLVIGYGMSPRAEEAATQQATGFFERLLELAGARDVVATLSECSWKADARTFLVLTWDEGPTP